MYSKASLNVTSISVTSNTAVKLFMTISHLAQGKTLINEIKIGSHIVKF